jgi:DNA-binding MarR family transcriptional regulator
MSIAAINWALNGVSGITSTEKAILIALADRADEKHCCFPSYEDLCHRSCATRNTVSKALKRFEEMRLLEREKRFGQSTIYRLQVPSSTKMHTTDKSSSTKMRTTVQFDQFWSAYPRKVNKKASEQAFNALKAKDRDAALKALGTYEFSSEQRYIPHASTWIRQRRFEDEVQTTTTDALLEI